jgi:acyl-coenzyme A synthetase/AMP-(fatty) acid ligase
VGLYIYNQKNFVHIDQQRIRPKNLTMNLVENLAYACLGTQIKKGLGDVFAFRWISANLSHEEFSYIQIESFSNRIAGILKNLGVNKGDRISIFLPRSP